MATKKKLPSKKVIVKAKKSVLKETSKRAAAKFVGKVTKPLTKSELHAAISDGVSISRKQVGAIFEQLNEIIALHLKGPEKFILPGMLKVVVKKVPARPARKGINPFTGEKTTFKAKPASKKVKVVALKSLKGFV